MAAIWKISAETGEGALMIELKEAMGIPMERRGVYAVLTRLEDKGYISRSEPSMSRLPEHWKNANPFLSARKRTPAMLLLEPLITAQEAAELEADLLVSRFNGQKNFLTTVIARLEEELKAQDSE